MKNIIIKTIGLVSCSISMGFAQNYQLVTTVKTPNNSTVQDTYTLTSADISQNQGQIAAYEAYVNSFGAELIEPQSYKYNCHGYAWNVAEGGSKVWIGRHTITAEDIYWTDGSYTEVTESNATKVSYHPDGNHSAIKLNGAWYQSKWGWGGGLVKHTLTGVDPIYQPSKTKKYYKKVPIISGPKLVLNVGSTYTLTGANGGTVTWTYSSNLRMRSSSNTSITVESLSASAGTGWIQASVGGASSPRYEVWVGKPVITGIFGETLITHPGENVYYYAQYNEKAAITSFDWIFVQGIDPTFWSSTSKNWIYHFFYEDSYQLFVRGTNANGTGNYCIISITADFPGMSPSPPSLYRISQDPASNELTVTPDTSVSQLSPLLPSSGAATNNYTVYLYNAGGAVVKQAVSRQGGEVRLDVSGLPNGIYYLLIDAGNGAKPESHKIIINH